MVSLRKAHVHRYFKHIYDECLLSPSLRGKALDEWTDTERLASDHKVGEVVVLSAAFLLFYAVPLLYAYSYIHIPVGDMVALGLVLLILVGGVLAIMRDVISSAPGQGRGRRPFLKDWPGQVRRFDVSMAEGVTWVSRALSDDEVGVRMFSVVLHDRRGEPHGMVLVTKRTFIRITIWKHWDDPGHTVVHIAPTNTRRRSAIRRLQGIVDDCLAD